MKLHKAILAAVMTVSLAQTAQAVPLCTYQAYAIDGTVKSLADALYGIGLQIIPSEEQGMFYVYDREEGVPALVGTWQVANDPYRRTKSIAMHTTDGLPLLTIDEEIGYCFGRPSSSTCFETNYQLRDEETISPAFTIRQGPNGLFHHRYGREVNVTSWRYGLDDIKDWLIQFYLTTSRVELELPPDTRDAIELLVSINPLLYPYADSFSLTWKPDGSLLVSGVLPSNASYSALIGILLDYGIYNFHDRLIIDTGLVGNPTPFSGPLDHCL